MYAKKYPQNLKINTVTVKNFAEKSSKIPVYLYPFSQNVLRYTLVKSPQHTQCLGNFQAFNNQNLTRHCAFTTPVWARNLNSRAEKISAYQILRVNTGMFESFGQLLSNRTCQI